MLSLWIRTSTASGLTPKRCTASISSKPLFISVALSTVIFFPILQVGCASVSATVTDSSSSRLLPKKGPPDAVRRILLISDGLPALKD